MVLRTLILVSFTATFFLINGCTSSIHEAISSDTSVLQDGIYLVERKGLKPKEILPLADHEKIITFNQEFIDKTDQGKIYVVVNKQEFAPLILKQAPTTQDQEDNRKRLMLTLSDKASDLLKQFTTRNLNRHTSIVVDGEALTMHKVRTVIDGGRLQVTRCTDNACEMLFFQLQDNVVKD